MKYEYAIIEVTPYNSVDEDVKKLDSYGKLGYKVVAVYQTQNEYWHEVRRIILMREVE